MGKTVAVIGASNDRSKYGNIAVRAYTQRGYTVYPINQRADTIEGLQAYRSIKDVPGRVDIVLVYVPPKIGIELLPDIAKKRPEEFYLNPGTESDEIVEKAKELGLSPILACSIVAIGLRPEEV
jgi:predicted CoA-binding protein